MALKKDRIEIYKSRRNGEYGWRYIAKNGKRVAVAGETYKNKMHCRAMVSSLFVGKDIDLVDKTGKP